MSGFKLCKATKPLCRMKLTLNKKNISTTAIVEMDWR